MWRRAERKRVGDHWLLDGDFAPRAILTRRGIIGKFRPVYLVRLANGKMLVLEVKGQDNQEQRTKRESWMNGCEPSMDTAGLDYGPPTFLAIPPIFTKYFKDIGDELRLPR